ncbi:hypothetical protein GCM10023211_00030 [Orbus sasakiae]|uniref:Lipoprotein n=2 Tax=Orbus sasakiae TaxID=1078475 RepID=A0ABP9MWI8_9GAMM
MDKKMRRSLFIFTPVFLVVSLLVGCAVKPVTTKSTVTTNKDLIPVEQYDYDKKLRQCVAESDYLAKKDKTKYGQVNTALIQILSGVKAYSSQLSQIDEKNKEIITSMYVYQVNDLCNSISQFYLAEVKKDLNRIVDKTKSN